LGAWSQEESRGVRYKAQGRMVGGGGGANEKYARIDGKHAEAIKGREPKNQGKILQEGPEIAGKNIQGNAVQSERKGGIIDPAGNGQSNRWFQKTDPRKKIEKKGSVRLGGVAAGLRAGIWGR